jgi:hypothetical protein
MTTKHTIVTISRALVAFVFGCVTEALVSSARAAPTATRWEFKCINAPHGPEQEGQARGQQGWELAAAGSVAYWCFKRPLP